MIKLFVVEVAETQKHLKDFVLSIISRELKVNKSELFIENDNFGKPYLRNYPYFHFNISHTKGAVVCAISDNPIGVDIERIKPLKKKIIERFFSENEIAYIILDSDKKDERFTEIWTKKESYIKWIGKGMEIPFESFDVISKNNIVSIQMKDLYVSVCSNEPKITMDTIKDNIVFVNM